MIQILSDQSSARSENWSNIALWHLADYAWITGQLVLDRFPLVRVPRLSGFSPDLRVAYPILRQVVRTARPRGAVIRSA
jgi:hypothetical protein